MDERVRQLGATVEELRQGSAPKATRFSAAFREQVIALARERRAAGTPLVRTASELGLHSPIRLSVGSTGAGAIAWEEDDGTGAGMRVVAARYHSSEDRFDDAVLLGSTEFDHVLLNWVDSSDLQEISVAWEDIAGGRSMGRFASGFDPEGRVLTVRQIASADAHSDPEPSTEEP